MAGLEIFTPWCAKGLDTEALGALNLLLAFNGVCKLYAKKGEVRERLYTGGIRTGRERRRRERGGRARKCAKKRWKENDTLADSHTNYPR